MVFGAAPLGRWALTIGGQAGQRGQQRLLARRGEAVAPTNDPRAAQARSLFYVTFEWIARLDRRGPFGASFFVAVQMRAHARRRDADVVETWLRDGGWVRRGSVVARTFEDEKTADEEIEVVRRLALHFGVEAVTFKVRDQSA